MRDSLPSDYLFTKVFNRIFLPEGEDAHHVIFPTPHPVMSGTLQPETAVKNGQSPKRSRHSMRKHER